MTKSTIFIRTQKAFYSEKGKFDGQFHKAEGAPPHIAKHLYQ
jgi:hypothetical protein